MLYELPPGAVLDKVYPLTLSASYVSHWTVTEAIRELFQNMLDQSQSGNGFSFENRLTKFAGNTSGTIELRNENTCLSPDTLLLGTSTSRHDEDKIGQFGEGYKLALLILARSGVKCLIVNGYYIWEPVIAYNDTFGCEMLCINQYKNPDPEPPNSLIFFISGLDADQYDEVITTNLHLQKVYTHHYPKEVMIHTENGTILLDPMFKGRIYVSGLFVVDLSNDGVLYGYDFNPGHITLNRDRASVGMWDVCYEALAMWTRTKQWDRIAEMIDMDIKDVTYAGAALNNEIKNACYRRFSSHGSGAIPVATESGKRELSQEHQSSAVIVNPRFYSAITSSTQYTPPPKPEPKRSPNIIVADVMQQFMDSKITMNDCMRTLLEYANHWTWKEKEKENGRP